ncbi:MAG: translesion DNA synthesis-associated protein ImuA [Betaproteobacteria bacterium]|nr:translesion DNA synthesis-associated protein ImuA [Betaproteobacteria bacterium]
MREIQLKAPPAGRGIPRHPALWRGGELARMAQPGVASGFAELDAALPGGGWPVAALTELMPAHEGIGELRLLGGALAALARKGQHLAWIAPPHLPYAPALAAAGIRLGQLLVVRTKTVQETLWATEQALRSNACGAVLAWPAPGIDYTQLRRLQVAAEGSRALAFLFRPPAASQQASPAVLRLLLDTDRGGLAVTVAKRRGAPLTHPVLIPALGFRLPRVASATAAATPSPIITSPNTPHALDRHPPAAAAA